MNTVVRKTIKDYEEYRAFIEQLKGAGKWFKVFHEQTYFSFHDYCIHFEYAIIDFIQ
jgi:hypothetical protein